jgi:hypothetical protein
MQISAQNHFKVQSIHGLIGTRQSALAALLVDKSRKIPRIKSRPLVKSTRRRRQGNRVERTPGQAYARQAIARRSAAWSIEGVG